MENAEIIQAMENEINILTEQYAKAKKESLKLRSLISLKKRGKALFSGEKIAKKKKIKEQTQ